MAGLSIKAFVLLMVDKFGGWEGESWIYLCGEGSGINVSIASLFETIVNRRAKAIVRQSAHWAEKKEPTSSY